MTTFTPCQCILAAASAGMNRYRFSNDQPILDQFSDLLACCKIKMLLTDAGQNLDGDPHMAINLREFALAISLVSFGSSQTFFLPQRKTLDAKRFWSLSMLGKKLERRRK